MRLTSSVSRLLATCGVLGLAAFSGLNGVGPAAGVAYAAGTTQNYLVVFKQANIPPGQAAKFAAAGGQLITTYDQIGVALVKTNNVNFRNAMLADPNVDDASSTAGLGYKLPDTQAGSDPANASGPPPGGLPNAPATDADTLSPLQWDMRQIKAPQAHAITGGSPAVLVGDIDTGVDFNHPDLKQNLDVADSANCLTGVAVPGLAAQDDNGHGTHTAGTIAAASNGFGIVGVAPNIRLAAIKAGTADGFFFPESVVCAFMWAATHHMDVTNNSYFADPWYFNCRNDATQRAIWKAEDRAIRFAMQNDVSVIAAAGNFADDLAHPTQDTQSPDNTTPVTREVTNACVVIPVEIPGVIGVSADGNLHIKSFYSNYGVSVIQVTAPGGDSVLQRTAEAPNGRVLSTWPPYIPCLRSVKEPSTDPNEPTVVYCYAQGTSMASPHVTGVAALIVSQFGDLSSKKGHMNPGAVQAYIDQTADPMACPSAAVLALYAFFPSVNNGAPQQCQGGTGYNSWYGNGQVDALNAVTHTTRTPIAP